ncbi:MAG: hypothetical protein ACRDXX_09460 [Stackebrandtia sp.]
MRLSRTAGAAAALTAAAALAVGCTEDGGGDPDDIELSVEISGTSDDFSIEYTATNVGDEKVVLYNLLEPGDRYEGDRATVNVNEEDGAVEFSHKIDHACQDDPDEVHCPDAAERVDYEVGGTVLGSGDEHVQELTLPARGEPGFVETRGKDVTFCLGFAVLDDDNPESEDGKYGPTSPQTVVCSEPKQLD